MTKRPFFSPKLDSVGVEERFATFTWNPGFAISQKQKNIVALHDAIRNMDVTKTPLEVSSKSMVDLGVKLSAFNLGVRKRQLLYTVESVFQASKVFSGGIGPFPELYAANPSQVRALVREKANSPLQAFKYGTELWGLHPTRAFYNWVYCRALNANPELGDELRVFNCFTDIEFNPKKSLNCQAYAVALYLSLSAHGVLEEALSCKDCFLKYHPQDIVAHAKTNHAYVNGSEQEQRENVQMEFGFDGSE